MELKNYLKIIRRWWWLLLLGLVLGGGGGYLGSRSQPLLYQAKTTLMIGTFIQTVNPSPSELDTSTRLGQSYAEMITREPILRASIEALNLNQDWLAIRNTVRGNLVPNTQLFEIIVTNQVPQQARLLADEIARQLIRQSPAPINSNPEQEVYHTFIKSQLKNLETKIAAAQQQLQDLEGTIELETTSEGVQRRQEESNALQSKLTGWQNTYASLLNFIHQDNQEPVNKLSVIEPATVPKTPINARSDRQILLGAGLGLIMMGGLIFLLEYLDDTLKTAKDVQQNLGLITLGTIPKIKRKLNYPKFRRNGQERAAPEPPGAFTEAYRILRTNLQFSSLLMTGNSATLLVTSPGVGEGKSTTAANLAIVMARGGYKTILVDADLRCPVQHKLFGLTVNQAGFTNLLANKSLSLDEVLIKTGINNLSLLLSGPSLGNSADILNSSCTTQLIAALTGRADLVIFDSPPVLIVTDATLLAKQTDGALLVLQAGRTQAQAGQKSKEILNQVETEFLGVVLNRFNPRWNLTYSYDHYTYYHRRPGKSPSFIIK